MKDDSANKVSNFVPVIGALPIAITFKKAKRSFIDLQYSNGEDCFA
jgi:hypothetical protein